MSEKSTERDPWDKKIADVKAEHEEWDKKIAEVKAAESPEAVAERELSDIESAEAGVDAQAELAVQEDLAEVDADWQAMIDQAKTRHEEKEWNDLIAAAEAGESFEALENAERRAEEDAEYVKAAAKSFGVAASVANFFGGMRKKMTGFAGRMKRVFSRSTTSEKTVDHSTLADVAEQPSSAESDTPSPIEASAVEVAQAEADAVRADVAEAAKRVEADKAGVTERAQKQMSTEISMLNVDALSGLLDDRDTYLEELDATETMIQVMADEYDAATSDQKAAIQKQLKWLSGNRANTKQKQSALRAKAEQAILDQGFQLQELYNDNLSSDRSMETSIRDVVRADMKVLADVARAFGFDASFENGILDFDEGSEAQNDDQDVARAA